MFHASKEDYRGGVIRQMAFLGRYAHQPLDVMMRTELSILTELAEAIGELLEAEGDQTQNSAATGGG
jgi:hypothetical protein